MMIKEYRVCMPLTVEEYKIGQLFMIAKHCHEQSDRGEGVEVIRNEPCLDGKHGIGRYTEKRIHLSRRLPTWIRVIIPDVFYVTEKAWNYYPYTVTEYNCSFFPRLEIHVETVYLNDKGVSDNCLQLSKRELQQREVDFIDIVQDAVSPNHFKEEEDLTVFKSERTGRGPLMAGWLSIRDILLLAHRQAVAWVDSWHGMTMEDLRQYEVKMFAESYAKVASEISADVDGQLNQKVASFVTLSVAIDKSADIGDMLSVQFSCVELM